MQSWQREDIAMTTRMLIRLATCTALAIVAQSLCPSSTRAQAAPPQYEVDPSWPKSLPGRWVTGGLGGVCVDARDHVLILNRQDVLPEELASGTLAPSLIVIAHRVVLPTRGFTRSPAQATLAGARPSAGCSRLSCGYASVPGHRLDVGCPSRRHQ